MAAEQGFKRRYISLKETVGYTLYDASGSISVGYDSRFLYDVFKISLDKIAITNVINGIWDVVNDTFSGVLVDKTRTRWGKFKPYLAAFVIPNALLTIIRFLSPLFLSENPDDTMKFVFYLGATLLGEGIGTFRGIAETGLFASLTPSPDDRVRLRVTATSLSSVFDNLPGVAMGVLMDMVNHQVVKMDLKTLFTTLGPALCIISTAISLVYIFVAKERVPQTAETPNIREGLTAVWRNKPMRTLLICDLMGIFSVGTDVTNYYIDVLGYASFHNLVQIPAIPMSLTSYTFVAPLRRRFEMKTLWIFGTKFNDFITIFLFLFGIIGGTGENGNYRKLGAMLPAFMVKDFLWKCTWGIKEIIPGELFNEALDYCEWKDGYRAEGMIISAKGLIAKLIRNSFSWVGTYVLKAIGYTVGAGFGQQGERVKYLIFMTSTILPAVTGGLTGIIPQLFYKLDRKTRDQMYEELGERRKAMVAKEQAAGDAVTV